MLRLYLLCWNNCGYNIIICVFSLFILTDMKIFIQREIDMKKVKPHPVFIK